MAEIQDLTQTAGSHPRFVEGQAPSTLNDGMRNVEGILSRWFFDTNHSVACTVSGTVIQMTASRVSITLTATTSNYIADLMMGFTVGSTALVGPLSVNINGIGPISLRDAYGTSLSGSIAPSGARLVIAKDDANNYFRLVQRPVLYAEGTWTPTLGDGSNNYTLSFALGSYTKIGNTVIAHFAVTWTNTGSAGAGGLVLGPLPFTTNSTTNYRFGVALALFEGLDTGGTKQITARASNNATVIDFQQNSDNANAAALAANSSSATGSVQGTIVYQV